MVASIALPSFCRQVDRVAKRADDFTIGAATTGFDQTGRAKVLVVTVESEFSSIRAHAVVAFLSWNESRRCNRIEGVFDTHSADELKPSTMIV
jgi:hypothetical protein